ncbi:MAG TPA: glucosyltransferase domain-containing protein [Candidatus Desulfovibrio gallistercoris]|nr:glucosyltransferase domain-containing protein [Candidatus Desulfovibrio gallistercoris]
MLSIRHTDLLCSLKNVWEAVPSPWKKAFFCALLVNVVVYFYDLAQFPLGDHDVGYMDGIPLLSGGRAGRWFLPFLHMLDGHVQIPVYTTLLGMATLIASGMAAVLLWKRDAGFMPLFAGAVVVSCHPAVTDFYYYHYMILGFTTAPLFLLLSIHCVMGPEGARPQRIFASVVLAVIGLASYQSAVMTWTTCMCGYVLVQISQWDGSGDELRARLKTLFLPVLCMCAGCLLYAVSLALYPLVGLSLALYQFETNAASGLAGRLVELVQQSWQHLFLPQGFVSGWLKGIFLLAMPAAFCAVWRQGRPCARPAVRMALLLLFFLLLPVATKSQFAVSSSSDWHLYRFIALGDNYMYAFFLVMLFGSGIVLARNAGLLLFALALPCMAVNLLDQQVRHVRSVEHDMAVLNRVVGRIEALPGYDPDKAYNLVQFGRTLPYLANSPGMGTSNPLARTTVSQAWHPGFELWHLSRYLKFNERINEESGNTALLAPAIQYARGRKAFPAPGSVGIVNDTIVLIFDEQAVKRAEQRLDAAPVQP